MKQDFRPLTEQELLQEITTKKPTLILFHRKPDADALGSALALRELFLQLGSNAICVCPSPLPERLGFLIETPNVAFGFGKIPDDFAFERVVSVDTASPSQLGDLYALYEGKINFMIDHHASGTPYANHYIKPDAAATGEILFDLAKELQKQNKILFSRSLCNNLYAAISSDTGGFRFANTSPATHRRAAELLELGADAPGLNHHLFDSKSKEQLLAESAAAANLRTYFDGRVSVVPFPYSLKKELGVEDEHLETLVEVARSLSGVLVAIAVRQPTEENTFWISARSSCNFDVSNLCSRFGGGGHKKAAGCNIKASDLNEAVEKLLSEIDPNELN